MTTPGRTARVEDHATRVLERVENFRALLTNLVNVQATLVAQRQNDEMARLTEAGYEQNEQVKRISSWAAIAFAPASVSQGKSGSRIRRVRRSAAAARRRSGGRA